MCGKQKAMREVNEDAFTKNRHASSDLRRDVDSSGRVECLSNPLVFEQKVTQKKKGKKRERQTAVAKIWRLDGLEMSCFFCKIDFDAEGASFTKAPHPSLALGSWRFIASPRRDLRPECAN